MSEQPREYVSVIIPEAFSDAARALAMALENYPMGKGALLVDEATGLVRYRQYAFMSASRVVRILSGEDPAPSPEAAAVITEISLKRGGNQPPAALPKSHREERGVRIVVEDLEQ